MKNEEKIIKKLIKRMFAKEKCSKILLFCDNPACFATHLAKKNYFKHSTGETK